jgi:hypothetical protein
MRRPTRDDDLRTRLARLDPAGGLPVATVSSPRAADHLERAMTSTELRIPEPSTGGRTRAPGRRRVFLGAAAVAAAAVMAGVLVTGGGGSPGGVAGGGGNPGGPVAEEPTTLALSLPPSNVADSCIVFDVAFLADMPVAFAGTVTEVAADAVVVDVDRWFTGGDSDLVRLTRPENSSAALDGVDFVTGERYLVTATNGTVNGCGFSGPATPELGQAFEQAFGG